MSKEIKPYRLLVAEGSPEDYLLPEQYLQLRQLPVETFFNTKDMVAATPLVKTQHFQHCE